LGGFRVLGDRLVRKRGISDYDRMRFEIVKDDD
jgi:hypothetical protein